MSLSISRQDVHVWYIGVRDCLERHPEAELLAILPEDERDQCLRSPLEKVRHERLVSRALIRFGHSWYVDAPPQWWRFRVNEFGRPELETEIEKGAPRLRFNASHSHGLVACAFAVDRDVGVDVEDVTRSLSTVEDISRYLSPQERAHLARVPENEERHTFFSYWTLKEAYAKAHGIGLSMGFDSFAVDLDRDPPALMSTDDADAWFFARVDVDPTYVVAVAARRAPGETLQASFRSIEKLF
jgi:4'-phosphopantetheinyl transferase